MPPGVKELATELLKLGEGKDAKIFIAALSAALGAAVATAFPASMRDDILDENYRAAYHVAQNISKVNSEQ
jgi:hypothetical protein